MKFKTILLYFLGILLLGVGYLTYKTYPLLYPSPRIADSPTSIIGFNHIGISVKNLDEMLAFYQRATDYKLLKRKAVGATEAVETLYGEKGIQYETAILKGPNMLLELTEFNPLSDSEIHKMPPQGPGMTHTCYQTPGSNSGYSKFKKAGVNMISRGDEPIDLAGMGMTYAYGYDPEGNIVELEQMSETLVKLQIGAGYAKQNPMWMTQVALMSPDLPRLIEYYEKFLAIKPYRITNGIKNPKGDAIVNIDNTIIDAAWFGLDAQGKKLELMQYVNPPTSTNLPSKKITDFGYTFSFEVLDIQKEYDRLKKLGIDFVSEPQLLEDFWTVFARDVDGNIFSLRQVVKKESQYSLLNF